MVVVVAALPLNLLAPPLLPNRPVPLLPNRPAPPNLRAVPLLRAARRAAAVTTAAIGTTAAASRFAAPRRRPAAPSLAAIVITIAIATVAASRLAASRFANPAAAAVEIASCQIQLAAEVIRATNKRPSPQKVGPLVFAHFGIPICGFFFRLSRSLHDRRRAVSVLEKPPADAPLCGTTQIRDAAPRPPFCIKGCRRRKRAENAFKTGRNPFAWPPAKQASRAEFA
jgi:hypothetical protein